MIFCVIRYQIHDILHFLPETNPDEVSFIWASEETGFRHLYLITACVSSNSRRSNSAGGHRTNDSIECRRYVQRSCGPPFHLFHVYSAIVPNYLHHISTDGYFGPIIKQKTALTSGDWEVLPRNVRIVDIDISKVSCSGRCSRRHASSVPYHVLTDEGKVIMSG